MSSMAMRIAECFKSAGALFEAVWAPSLGLLPDVEALSSCRDAGERLRIGAGHGTVGSRLRAVPQRAPSYLGSPARYHSTAMEPCYCWRGLVLDLVAWRLQWTADEWLRMLGDESGDQQTGTELQEATLNGRPLGRRVSATTGEGFRPEPATWQSRPAARTEGNIAKFVFRVMNWCKGSLSRIPADCRISPEIGPLYTGKN